MATKPNKQDSFPRYSAVPCSIFYGSPFLIITRPRPGEYAGTVLKRSFEADLEAVAVHDHQFSGGCSLIEGVVKGDQGVLDLHAPIDLHRLVIHKDRKEWLHGLVTTMRFSMWGWTGECCSR